MKQKSKKSEFQAFCVIQTQNEYDVMFPTKIKKLDPFLSRVFFLF